MRRLIPAFFAMLVFSGVAAADTGGPDAYGYTWDDGEPYVWEDISGTGTLLDNHDEEVVNASLGFDFVFYGALSDAVGVSPNGHLTFNYTTDFQVACDWTDIALYGFAGKWADLTSTSIGTIYVQTLGEAPNRKFVAQWEDMPSYNDESDRTTLQVVLEEGSNDIVVYIKDALASQLEALGIKNIDDYLQPACGTGVIGNEYAVRFRHPTGKFFVIPEASATSGDLGKTAVHELAVLNLTGSKGAFNLTYAGNTWTTAGPASLEVADGAIGRFEVSVEIPATAAYGDSDAATVTVEKDSQNKVVSLTTLASCDLLYDDGVMESQVGCAKKGPCYIGTVFSSSLDLSITNVKTMFSSGSGITEPNPYRICFYEATVEEGPTGEPLTCEGPYSADALDIWHQVNLPAAVEVDDEFAVVLDQLEGFLSVGVDTSGNAGRGWVSRDEGAAWMSMAAIGVPGNLMLRASYCAVATDDDDDDDDNDDNDNNDDDNNDEADDDAAADDDDDDTSPAAADAGDDDDDACGC